MDNDLQTEPKPVKSVCFELSQGERKQTAEARTGVLMCCVGGWNIRAAQLYTLNS